MTKYFSLLLLIFSFHSYSAIVCFEDKDGDGFVPADAKRIEASTDRACRRKGGVVELPGVTKDCNPNDSRIYPNAPERADGLDNNCDGLIDEPRFHYSRDLPSQQMTPAINSLRLKINDQETLQTLFNNGELYYQLNFKPLNGENSFRLPNRTDKYVATRDDFKMTTLSLDIAENLTHPNLKRFVAYQITLKFFRSNEDIESYQTSAPHYVITGGESGNPLTQLEKYRLKMGLNGLYQVGDSKLGKIGVNGTVDVDGTRFGARKGTTWCDQFWTWLAIEASDGNGFAHINSNNVPGYFRDPQNDGMWDVNHQDPTQRVVGVDNRYFDDGRGKWGLVLYDPIKSEPKNGKLGDMLLGPSHVFMLFSVDPINNIVYSIEGNVSNQAAVRAHTVHENLPNPAIFPTRNAGPERNYIVGIGKLQRYMFEQR